jgi:hypothetical protein
MILNNITEITMVCRTKSTLITGKHKLTIILYRLICGVALVSVSFRHSPGGALPPRAKRWAPRGKLSKKFLCRCCPTKPPRGDALGSAGEKFPGEKYPRGAQRWAHPSSFCNAGTVERAVGKLSGKESWSWK